MLIIYLSTAYAHESNPKIVHTSDTVQVFDNVQVDSGWQPSSGDLGVKLFAGAVGGAQIDMLGTSNLRWPDDLTLTMSSSPNSGLFILDFQLTANIGLRFDIGSYQWEGDVPVSTIPFYKEVEFDPYLLGENLEVSDNSGGNTLVDFNVSPIPFVDLIFSGVLTPNLTMNYSGNRWEFQDQLIEQSGDEVYWPPLGQGALDVEGQFFGDFNTSLSLEFSPVMSVCVPLLGCYDLEIDALSFPVMTIDDQRTHAFPMNSMHFELPVAEPMAESHDFGEHQVGDSANWPLLIENTGELYLDMDVDILGDTDHFTIWPDGVYSPAESEDGLTITYHPLSSGSHSATLILTSNDPYRPVIEIPINGSAVAEELEDDSGEPGDDSVNTDDVDGEAKIVESECGCSTSSKPLYWVWTFGLFAFVRRRQ